jgi:pimeloyl-ACP methyl ester carboxylesterase
VLESAVTIIALVVIGLPLLMFLAQDSLIFHPRPMAEGQRAALAAAGVAESIFLDGEPRRHAWHVKGEPLVLYFGGNAEEVSWMLEQARRAPGTGWLLVDYRGYGSSSGSPSAKALGEDGLRWYDRFAGRRIFVFGRSLGSGVAVHVAAARPVAGVVLVAPFDSMVEMGKHYYPFLPVSLLLRHRFESAAAAPGITAPLLCIVAERDEIIPAERSRALYDAWAGPKRWVELKGAGHNSTDDAANYWPSILDFIKK